MRNWIAMLGIIVTCRVAEPAGEGRPPIDSWVHYQADDGTISFTKGCLSWETVAGEFYRACRDTPCVVELGELDPPGTDMREEEDK